MILRELTAADYGEFLTLYRALDDIHVDARPDCFVSREEVYPREPYDSTVADPDCLLIGAFSGDKMTGFVRATLWHESVMVKNMRTVCLDNIYVLPEYRRTGVGRKLFEAVETWARKQGAVRLDLHTWDFNETAIAMYRAMGMTPQQYVFEKKL